MIYISNILQTQVTSSNTLYIYFIMYGMHVSIFGMHVSIFTTHKRRQEL